MKKVTSAALLLASLALAACGGGSSSGTPEAESLGGAQSVSQVSPLIAPPVVVVPPPIPGQPPITQAAAATDADGKTEVGIGLYHLTYWDQSFAMVDVVRHAQFRGMDWSYEVGADTTGAPTRDFRLVYSSIIVGAGTYKLKFKGQANVTGVTNKVYDVGTNTTTADYVLASNATGNQWIEFTNTRRTPVSTTADGVTELQMFRPGYATDGSAVFTSEFIQAMRKFHVIRTMDFVRVNLNPTENWSERTRINFLGDTDVKGQSWELMVLLANATGRDLWINVPVKANDQYIDKLAKLIKYGSDGNEPYTTTQAQPKYPPLRSDLKVYVEYGNEIWNPGPGFSGFAWALEYANANRLNTSHPIAYDGPVTDQWTGVRRWVAYRSATISRAFRNNFGDVAMMSRVRPILATQVGNANNYLRDGLLWAEGYYGNARDLWYGGGGAAYYESDAAASNTSMGTMAAYFAGLPSAEFARTTGADAIWTKGFGLKTVAYEGGPAPGGLATGGVTGTDELSYAYNNDIRMKDRMQVAHNTWIANGGDMLVYYVYSAPAPWSFTNGAANPTVSDTTSVKLQAIDAIRTNTTATPSLGTAIPGTVYLRAPSAKVIDIAAGGTQWGYNGTAYRITPSSGADASKSEFLLVPVHAATAGTYKISLNTYDSTANDRVELFANGKLVGEISATPSTGGQAIKSSEISAELESGVTVFRIRAKAGNGVWLKDVVVTR